MLANKSKEVRRTCRLCLREAWKVRLRSLSCIESRAHLHPETAPVSTEPAYARSFSASSASRWHAASSCETRPPACDRRECRTQAPGTLPQLAPWPCGHGGDMAGCQWLVGFCCGMGVKEARLGADAGRPRRLRPSCLPAAAGCSSAGCQGCPASPAPGRPAGPGCRAACLARTACVHVVTRRAQT